MLTERTRVRRLPKRGAYDRDTIDRIIDEAIFCHVGYARDDQPFVIPTMHARDGDSLLIHGSAASRMLQSLQGGAPVCVTITLIDGLVLARSAFHHSINYRSVVILGTATLIDDRERKLAAMGALVDKVQPGRWDRCRRPNEKEMAATSVLALPITEASAKLRAGPPVDDEEDYALPHWAGVIPLELVAGEPEPDPRLRAGIAGP